MAKATRNGVAIALTDAWLAMVLACSVVCSPAHAQKNLLVNPGFELDADGDGSPDGWKHSAVEGGKMALDEEVKLAGERSVRLMGFSLKDRSDIDQVIPVTVGNRYRLSLRYKIGRYEATGFPGPFISAYFMDRSGKMLGNQMLVVGRGKPQGWKQLTKSVDAPIGAESLSFGAHFCRAIGAAWFDEMSVELAGKADAKILELDSKAWQRVEYAVKTPGRPRLYFTADRLEQMRAMADTRQPNPLGVVPKDIYEKLISAAERHVAETSFTVGYGRATKVEYPVPPEQPRGKREPPAGMVYTNYPYWTSMAICIKERMEALALAAALTGDERFVNKARDYALALAGWEIWSDPYYGNRTCNLDTCYLSVGTAAVYDMVYDHLSEQDRTIVRKALIEKGLRLLQEKAIAERARRRIQTTGSSSLGIVSLALLGDDPEVVDFINTAVSTTVWNFDSRQYTHRNEGLGYYINIDYALRLGDILQRVAGDDAIISHPYLEQGLVPWVTYFVTPDGKRAANFCDSHGRAVFLNSMSILNRHGNGHAGWYLKHTGMRGTPLEGVLYYDPDSKVTQPDDLPLGLWLRNIGWVAMRSDWDHDGIMFALKSGKYYASHAHQDQGTFMINVAGDYLAADPGYRDPASRETMIFTRDTQGHNGILVDGDGHLPGDGKIEEFFTSPGFDYVRCEQAEVYPQLKSARRTVAYLRPNIFVVCDDLAPEQGEHDYEWLLHGERGGRTRIVCGGKEFPVGKSAFSRDDALTPGVVRIVSDRAALQLDVVEPARVVPQLKTDPGLESHSPWLSVPQKGAAIRYITMLTVESEKFPAADPKPELHVRQFEDSSGFVLMGKEDRVSVVLFAKRDRTNLAPTGGLTADAWCLLQTNIKDTSGDFAVIGALSFDAQSTHAMTSGEPFSAWFRIGKDGCCSAIIEARADCRLTLVQPNATVSLDGLQMELQPGPEARTVTCEVPAGHHKLTGTGWRK